MLCSLLVLRSAVSAVLYTGLILPSASASCDIGEQTEKDEKFLVSFLVKGGLCCCALTITFHSPNTRGTLKGFNDIPMFIQPRGRDGPSASRRSFFCLNLQRLSRFLKNQEPGAFKWKLLEQIKNILQK